MRRSLPLLALAPLAALPAQDAEIAAIQVPEELTITAATAFDVDRDGRDDLVIAARDTRTGRREVRVHLRAAAAPWFQPKPSRPPYVVETDVIAFTFADCTPAKGRELVLLTADRVVAVDFADDGTPTYVPLLQHDLVWPAANPDFVLPLPGAAVDVDADGREDLLLPQTWGTLLHLQNAPGTPRGGEFDRPVVLVLPAWRSPIAPAGGGPATLRGDELSLGLRLGDGDDEDDERKSGPLVRVRTRTPPCLVADVDGDGHLDLAAIRNGRAFFAMQALDGTWRMHDVALPLPEDRLTLFDPAFDVQLADVDGDRRLDLMLTTSASRGDELEVRIDLFRTRGDGSWPAKPDCRLRLQTLARPPQLVDADGDGRLDVIAVTVRTDALRGLTGGAPTALDAQCNLFRGTGERFEVPAMLIAPLRLPAKAQRGGGAFVEVVAGGNGAPGALLLREGDVLQRRPFRRDGDRLQLVPPTTRVPIPDKARLDASRDGEVLVRSEHEVLHVRTR